MRRSSLLCLLFGALAWGQASPGTPTPAPGNTMQSPAPAAQPTDSSASVAPEAAVLTITGVCPPAKAAAPKGTAKPASGATAPKAAPAATKTSECKTVITRAQFEKMVNALAPPNRTQEAKRQLVTLLPRLLALSQVAEKQGLDKTPEFQEKMKFYRMQLLAGEVQRKAQEDAGKVSDQDVEAYFKEHPSDYEQFNLDRLFVPRMKQVASETNDKDEKLTDEQQKNKERETKAKQEEGEQEMTKLAASLQARAAAGEDFLKLQKEAFEAAGMKIDSPTVNLPKIRKNGLPPAQASAFDLKQGEVSQVISDAGGHYIYKVNSKEEMPLDQVKTEIHNALQSQRMRESMEKVQNSYKVDPNQAYFGAAAAGAPNGMPRAARPAQATPAPAGQGPAQPQNSAQEPD